MIDIGIVCKMNKKNVIGKFHKFHVNHTKKGVSYEYEKTKFEKVTHLRPDTNQTMNPIKKILDFVRNNIKR